MQVPRERRCLIGIYISILPIISTFTDGPQLCELSVPTVVEEDCGYSCANHDDSFCENNIFCSWPAKSVLKDDILPQSGGSNMGGRTADFWLSIDASGGTFRIDLGCKATVNEFHLRNGGAAATTVTAT